MDTAHLPVPHSRKVAATAGVRVPAHLPRLGPNDAAVRAMTDFRTDPPLTITADQGVEPALDAMFRAGVRACLVVRDRAVIGLLTAERARDELRRARAQTLPLAIDVMTDTADVPAMDWQTLLECRVRDLLDIFEGAGVEHLVILENETVHASSVRGMIHRSRLERQMRIGTALL